MNNKYLYLFLLIFCTTSFVTAQNKELYDPYTPEYFTGNDPAWLQDIQKNPRGVNFFEMEKKFAEWLKNDPDAKKKTPEKKPAVNFYRRWKRAYEPFANSKGEIVLPTKEEYLRQLDESNRNVAQKSVSKRRSRRSLGATSNRWKNIGPYATAANLNTGYQPSYDSHANVFRIDISKTNSNVLYCGAETGVVFKTTDKGLSWNACDPTFNFGAHITAIKIDPTDENIVWVGSNSGLFLSKDGGQSFTRMSDITSKINSIRISPQDTDLITVAAENGFYVSNNKGASFTKTFNGECHDHELKPKSPNTVYLLAKKSGDDSFKFYTSTDGGFNFNQEKELFKDTRMGRLAVSDAPNGENYVYALITVFEYGVHYGAPRILQSKDSGETWTDKTVRIKIDNKYYDYKNTFCPSIDGPNGGQGYYDMMIGVSDTNPEHVIFGLCSAYRSLNGGEGGYKANAIGGYCNQNLKIHADMQDIAISGDEVWIANDGGIKYSPNFFKYENNGITAENRVKGIYAADYHGFGQGWNEDVMAGGRWHNGDAVIIPNNYGEGKAVYVGGVERATGYVMVSNPKKVYFSDTNSMFTMPDKVDGQVTWEYKFFTQPHEGLMSHGFLATDPRYAQRILFHKGTPSYGGSLPTNQIWETKDEGSTFNMLFDTEGESLSNIVFARSNPDVIYACGIYDIYKSVDNGKNWNKLERSALESIGFQYSTFNPTSYLQVDPRDENRLWIVKARQAGAVAFSKNGGKKWENPLNEEMKKMEFRWVILTGDEHNGVYLGTEKGAKIYYRDDTLPDKVWIDYSEGLPSAVRLTKLLPFYKDGKLRAATNQGIWEIPLYRENFKPVAQPLALDIAGPELSNANTPIQFDSYSIVNQNGAQWEWTITPEPYSIIGKNTRNPRVVFKYNGDYDVTLKVTNSMGQFHSRTISKMIKVSNGETRPNIPEPVEPEKKVCIMPPYMNGTLLPTKIIISTSNSTSMDVIDSKNGFIKMESINKPFVITRLSTQERNNIPNPVEGMLIWNKTKQCLELYKDFGEGLEWRCITQGCNE